MRVTLLSHVSSVLLLETKGPPLQDDQRYSMLNWRPSECFASDAMEFT